MKTINKVILIGNITKDPFVKVTANGKKVVLFTVATNHSYKNASGELLSESEFTGCVAWGVLAERAEQFLNKGKLVYIEGHLKTRSLDRDDGSKFFKTEVVISELIFLSKKEAESLEASNGGFTPNEHSSVFDDFSDLNETI
jgi:single-strand DNA-binding protein